MSDAAADGRAGPLLVCRRNLLRQADLYVVTPLVVASAVAAVLAPANALGWMLCIAILASIEA